jgi:hypothetical protein
MRCKDPATTYLAELGYNVVRYPDASITPLTVFGQFDGASRQLGSLKHLATSSKVNYPKVSQPKPAPAIKFQNSSKLKFKFGVKILAGFLGALGAQLDVSASFTNAKTVQFQFGDVSASRVVPAEVGAYLDEGEIDFDAAIFEPYLFGPGRLFVITDVLLSKSITTKFERADGVAAVVKLPALSDLVGGNVAVSADSTEQGVITYAGQQPVTFAFRCLELEVKDGGDISVTVPPAGATSLAGATGAEDFGEIVTPDSDGLLDFRITEQV